MDVKHNAWFNCLLPLFSCFCLNTELALGDGISTNQSLVGYQTIVSPEGNFVLGFFRPGNSSKFYIGIWYNKLSEQTPVWVANRETPVSDSSSSELKIDGGNLVLLNESSHQIWSTNLTPTNSSSVEAVLGDDGNLVLRDGSNTSQPLWQSFDHPTDTFLPGSKMGLNKKTGEITRLISWKSSTDPSPGLFSLGLDPNGTSQFSILWNLTDRIWASGLWNEQNKIFENIPEMTLNYIYNFSYVDNENERYFTYSLYNTSYVSRLTMDWNGQIENTVWFRDSKQWLLFWSQPRNKTASAFSRNKNNKRIIVTSGVVGSAVAVVLVGLLIFLIFRRKRAINPGKAMEGSIIANGYRDVQNGTNNFLVTLEDLVGSATPLHDTQKRIKDLIDSGDFDEEDKKSIDVHSFDFDSLVAATDDFSDANKLGQGGFGPVYKGRFPGGQEIAIKRLSSVSAQGLEEFKNEVLLIAKLQHRNLVRILGYCFKGDEKILVYEYLPNKSLDFSIFDEKRNTLLNWEVRFNIILGIARGLLYLHQDSRLRIVHRDLKTSNILLDKELNPKISDFGLAKIVVGKNNEGFTTRVVGTYGYMSPEYALDGLFSVKSDVFSFGVVVLEILSGKKNTAYFQSEDVPSLLGYAWKLWREEKPLELMDENLSQSCNAFEFLKCMNVALLCIQDDPADRPNMSNVVVMLISETETFPTPKQPAFFARGAFTTSTVNKVLLSSSRIEEEEETCPMAPSERGN